MDKEKNRQLIELRPAAGKDEEFLYRVYADTRIDEITVNGWTGEEVEAFLRQQFSLQHRQYHEHYEGAQFDIILYNKAPAGRLYVYRGKKEIRIMDIALLREFRRQGVGSKLMDDLIAEADEKQLPLNLHVEHNNPAMGLYEQLGFEKGELRGVYYFMERPPAGGPSKPPRRGDPIKSAGGPS